MGGAPSHSRPPRPSLGLIVRLVLALLALLALGHAPHIRPPEVNRCRLHLTAMSPTEVPSTWSDWPVSLDVTEALRLHARLEEGDGSPPQNWQYLGSVDTEICADDARTFSRAARPPGAAAAVRVVSDQEHEATRYVAISAAPEHVVAAFRAEWRDDSYVKNEPRGMRSSMAEDARSLSLVWIPGALAFLLCLLPLAWGYRFSDARRYVPGALGADGELSIIGANGETERVTPPHGWQGSGDAGPVLIQLAAPTRTVASSEPQLPYRETPEEPDEKRARSVTFGTPAQIFREAEQLSRWGLVILTVVCAFVWLIAQVCAMIADWPNC